MQDIATESVRRIAVDCLKKKKNAQLSLSFLFVSKSNEIISFAVFESSSRARLSRLKTKYQGAFRLLQKYYSVKDPIFPYFFFG